MSERKDGGPAFPQNSSNTNFLAGGMSLRDYFAIHAPKPEPAAVLAAQNYDRSRNPHNDGPPKPRIRDEFEIDADLRYQYADAMFKERDK